MDHDKARKGMIIVLSSPSGAGKSTLSQMILQHDTQVVLSVSVTTRKPRVGEQDGVDYHFISEEDFHQRHLRGDLLEAAQVFDHHYGTPRAPVLEALESGHDVLFDIDWQGAQQLRASMGDTAIHLFILPPSREELERRLRKRSTDSDEVITRRMSKADQEISHFKEYDWVIINENIDQAFAQVMNIIHTERLRLRRQPEISQFAQQLLSTDFHGH